MNHVADTFYVLDFDRCLGRTDAFQLLLESIIQRSHVVDLKMVQYAHEQVHRTGGSFDTATYIRQVLNDRQLDGEKIWHKIETQFILEGKKQDLLEPGARKLLHMLDNMSAPYGILTYGGKEWQLAKIRAAGLQSVSHLITSRKEKGLIIAGWQQPNKEFIIPATLTGGEEMRVARVALVDDKPISFIGVPAEVRGVCVSPAVSSPSLIENLPSNVTIVQGMNQVVRELFKDESDG